MRTASLAAAWCALLKKALLAAAWCSSRHPFFKEAELGARIAAEGCKFHFFVLRFHFLPKMTLTTVTHFGPLDPPPEAIFMSKVLLLLKVFDGFS